MYSRVSIICAQVDCESVQHAFYRFLQGVVKIYLTNNCFQYFAIEKTLQYIYTVVFLTVLEFVPITVFLCHYSYIISAARYALDNM